MTKTKLAAPHKPAVRMLAHEIGTAAHALNHALANGEISLLAALKAVQSIESNAVRLGERMRALFDAGWDDAGFDIVPRVRPKMRPAIEPIAREPETESERLTRERGGRWSDV